MFDQFSISASGMQAQRLRMNTIASNLANVETTRTADGGAYRRKDVLFAADQSMDFGSYMKSGMDNYSTGVRVMGVVEDQRPLRFVYDPKHPDADTNGYVAFPNVNAAEEMVNMISASRSYEANVNAFKASREMITKALEISG